MMDQPDDFYEALLAAHQGLSLEQSHALNARLILLLADRVGSDELLRELLQQAKSDPPVTPPTDGENSL